jgi:hypothetical protein
MFNSIKYISTYFVTLNKKVMKKLMLFALILFTLNSYAQYSKSKKNTFKIKSEFYVPSLIMGSTLVVNNQNKSITDNQSVQLAFVAIGTSTATYFLIKKVKKRIKNKCYKKQNKYKHKY